jgi:V/A-type H+-transporting ATPase subunit E
MQDNGTQKITQRIIGDARQTAEEQMAAAKAEAAQKLADVKAQADQILRRAQAEAASTETVQRQRKLSAIDSELRKEVLATRRNLMDRAFERALGKMAAAPAEKQVAFLAARVAEASPEGIGEIMLTVADKAKFGDQLLQAAKALYAQKGVQESIRLSDQPIRATGGFILKIGDIEYNFTYDSLVKMSRDEMEGQVASILFSAKNTAENNEVQ